MRERPLMFTQAGFRDDYEVLGRADVGIRGRPGMVTGVLMRWPSGDIAWGSRTRIVWPDQAFIFGGPSELIALSETDAGRKPWGGVP